MTHTIEQKNAFQLLGRKQHMTCYSQIDAMEQKWLAHAPAGDKDLYYVELPASYAGASEGFVYAIGWLSNDEKAAGDYEIITVPGGRYAVFDVPEEDLDDVGHFKGMIHAFLTKSGNWCDGVEIQHVKPGNDMEVAFLLGE